MSDTDSGRLIQVYIAADVPDAHLVRSLLDDADIPAVVQGEMLSMAKGDLPLGPVTSPTVWVHAANAERARELIEQREAHTPSDRPAWTCEKCGEQIEGQFTECWRCAGSTPD